MKGRLLRRANALRAVRDYFASQDVLEVDTPALVPSPGLDLHLDAFEVTASNNGGQRYLITSPEYQMKRLLAAGLGSIFQVSRCFRQGERGRWHNPEFLMVEWYRSGFDYHDMMSDTEGLVRHVSDALGGRLELDGRAITLNAPFERMTVSEAFAQFGGVEETEMLDMANGAEENFFRVLVDRVEPGLASLPHPVFVHDYPAAQASLSRLKPSDNRYCERFELYIGGVEVCNGFGELVDPIEQRARLNHDAARRAEEGKPAYPIDERFLGALEQGIAPCSGNALGFDRLLALCLGAPSIADVMAFGDESL